MAVFGSSANRQSSLRWYDGRRLPAWQDSYEAEYHLACRSLDASVSRDELYLEMTEALTVCRQ